MIHISTSFFFVQWFQYQTSETVPTKSTKFVTKTVYNAVITLKNRKNLPPQKMDLIGKNLYTQKVFGHVPLPLFCLFCVSISFLILNNILEDPIDEGEPKSQCAREKFIKSANSGNPTYSKGFLFDFLYLFINIFLFCDFS